MSPVLVAGLVLGASLLLGALLTPLVRGAALAGGLVRGAQADRWHKRPTPAIGGVAIFVAFGLTLGGAVVLDPGILGSGLAARAPHALLPFEPWEGLLVAATLGFLIGLVDDLRPMAPMVKLVAQVVAASVLLLSGIGVWLTGVYVVDAAISLFWFIGVTNAVNLLDNMDGLAGGTAAIAAVYLGVLYFMEGQFGLVLVALAVVGGLLGFLAHNYPPARIFMGDSGSIFLGLLLSGLALAPVEGLSRSLLAVLAAPALVLAIPILDTTLVTVGRVLEGRPISQGGTDHASHRLVSLGVSEERAVWILWALAAAGGGAGILLRTAARPVAALLGGLLLVGLIVVGAFLVRVRFDAVRSAGGETRLQERILALHDRYPVGLLLADALIFGLAYYAAYLLRWDGPALGVELDYFQRTVGVVVVGKLLAFTILGLYGPSGVVRSRVPLWRVMEANGLGTVLVLAGLLLTERVGLSRGVVGLDLLLCVFLTLGVRASFRVMTRAARNWSITGTPTILVGRESELDLALRILAARRRTGEDADLRPVALADADFPALRSRVGGLRMYGTPRAVMNAVQETGASAVVVLVHDGDDALPPALDEYLGERGALDLYRLNVELRVARSGGGTVSSHPAS